MAQCAAVSGAILVIGKVEESQRQTVRIALPAAIKEAATSQSFYSSAPGGYRHSIPLAKIVSRRL